ncbi:unnamed protein product [Didymodactylos carnosus]|uniref:BED-type domain-containing protein n=1 Tax=Didymodactylos carnosus TaxID=1234261 RepID=A0A8S2CXH4_9BILA|nr:unnamed protein product [Didymodactylos carnosus]CAF3541559.1 unnamed protein product [Didymodactylos carnosus]
MSNKWCAKCTVCSIVIKDTTKTTSNFVKHLQTKHSKQYDEWKQLKTKENPVSQQRSITDRFGEPKRRKTYPSSHSRQKELSMGIVKHLIAEMGLPLSLVERNSFKMFMKLVDNKYKCISRRHITRSMLPDPELYVDPFDSRYNSSADEDDEEELLSTQSISDDQNPDDEDKIPLLIMQNA